MVKSCNGKTSLFDEINNNIWRNGGRIMRYSYPRPDFVRNRWMCLNGEWDFYIEDKKMKIQVPFVFQSKMSGIGKEIQSDYMVYQRNFQVPAEWKGEVIRLNFGAVDYECSVYINGNMVGVHKGGSTPFSFAIDQYLTWDNEQITVKVTDPLKDETISRGKQFWDGGSRFIWYTPSSGIWQTVWLEPVDSTRFEFIHFTPNIDNGTVKIVYQLSRGASLPCNVDFHIRLGEEEIFDGTFVCRELRNTLTVDVYRNRALNGSFHFTGLYWTPENPILFDVIASIERDNKVLDSVSTYFGMRKIHVENNRFYLNNKPYYSKLLLDQGYWKDSLIIAPTDESFKEDIEKFKMMGFNGVRKHEKVEDPAFLYWADRLGFLVWESMPSMWSYTTQNAAEFAREWADVIQRDYNHPSIVVWGMLNESWGVPRIYDNKVHQSFANSLYYLAHAMDETRLVISNDGWELTKTDICALHSYQHGAKDDCRQYELFKQCLGDINQMYKIVEKLPYAKGYFYNGEPVILTECGGISVGEDAKGWGYTNSKTKEDFILEYERVIDAIYSSDLICGFCYTQATDVEQEVNGLLTDSHEFKFDYQEIKRINDKNGGNSSSVK
jgi:hypothetical protein